jgi:uncharacterized spore protein YtfJ
MFLDDLQKRFADMHGKAGWKTVFGDVIEVDGHRLIPVASVQYGFGMGGGQGPTPAGPKRRAATEGSNAAPGGGGGGGGMRVEPVALIDLSNGRVRVEPIINFTKLAIVALVVAAWSIFWMARAANGRTAAPRP